MSNPIPYTAPSSKASLLSIFFLSILILFLEMMLIRWIGTEIRIFAYIQSSILVTCFLALGMGCMRSESPKEIRSMLIPLAILAGFLTFPLTKALLPSISLSLSTLGDFHIWYKGDAPSRFDILWRIQV